jgi:pilus assembly protein CpaB
MRAVFGLVLVLGMALAGAAVYMIQGYIAQTDALLKQERAFNAKAGKLVEVYVFNKSLNYGDALTPEDVELIYWPEKALPETIFRDPAVLFPENADGPRYIMRKTEAYEPVLASRVTEPGELAGLTAKLGPGMRAFQIKVGVASGVAGFVQPDDFVDVYWTGSINGIEQTRLIESAVQIIAVNDAFNEGQSSGGSAGTITVGVTPEKVARLTLAQSTGRLTMSLVGADAGETSEDIQIDPNALLGIVEEEVVVVPEVVVAEKCFAKQRNGTEIIETNVEIPCKN